MWGGGGGRGGMKGMSKPPPDLLHMILLGTAEKLVDLDQVFLMGWIQTRSFLFYRVGSGSGSFAHLRNSAQFDKKATQQDFKNRELDPDPILIRVPLTRLVGSGSLINFPLEPDPDK